MDKKSGKLKNNQMASNSLGKWEKGGAPLKMSALEGWREKEGLGTPEIVKQQEEEKKARGRRKEGKNKGAAGSVNTALGYVPEGPYVAEEIFGGSMCVEEEVSKLQVRRSATVKYFCGQKTMLINVVETRSCHYELAVTVPGLCKGKGWRKEEVREKVVKCAIESE